MSTNQSRVQHGLENANLILLEILINQVINNSDFALSVTNPKLHNALCDLDNFMNNRAGSK